MVAQLDPSWISEVGVGFRASKALLSAVDLDLFTEPARGPLGVAELQKRSSASKPTRAAGEAAQVGD